MLNFSLLTPLRQESEDGLSAVEFKPRRLKQWLERRGELDPAQSIQELLDATARLSAKDLPEKLRQDLLDVYRSQVNGIFEAFDSDPFRWLPTDDEPSNRLAQSLGDLISALADGYKVIVRRSDKKAVTGKDSERLRRAIYCAMEQTIHCLLHAFRLYAQVTAGTYHQLHWLYRLAEKQHFLYTPVVCGGEPVASESIGKLYKQLLLFCVADPYHMGRREVVSIFRFFGRYATAAQLDQDKDWRKLPGHFMVDLASDRPPGPSAKVDRVRPPEDPRVIDTRAVVTTAIRDQVNQGISDRHRVYAEWAKRLIAGIVPDFQGIQPRKEPRNAAYRRVSVVVGLRAVHRVMEVGRSLLAKASAEQDTTISLPPHHSWTVLNEAPGGYRLSGKQGALEDGEVGDLIGILEASEGDALDDIRIAIIRWIRGLEDEGLVLGTERIDAPAVPVICRQATKKEAPLPCLLLSGSEDGRFAATLLCPGGIYTEGLPIEVEARGQKLMVRLTETIMHTPSLARYRFRHEKTSR